MDRLTPVVEKFVLHWGEMGTRWGINRTVAQVHALLFVAEKPLNAEQIVDLLGVARSNVSNSLRELQGWGIVRVVHVMGDRRDHFESVADVWDLFRQVIEERKKREIDPTVSLLRECVAEAGRAGPTEKYPRKKLGELLEFFQTTTEWYERVRRLPTSALVKFFRAASTLRKMTGG